MHTQQSFTFIWIFFFFTVEAGERSFFMRNSLCILFMLGVIWRAAGRGSEKTKKRAAYNCRKWDMKTRSMVQARGSLVCALLHKRK